MSQTPRRRPRPRTVAIGALVALLAAAPFVPRDFGDDGALSPSGDAAPGAGVDYGTVSASAQAQIERTLARGTTASAALEKRLTPTRTGSTTARAAAPLSARTALATGRVSARQVADTVVRCLDLEGQRYCLGRGWTDESESTVQAESAASAERVLGRRAATDTTGDLDAAAYLTQAAALTPSQRAEQERRELTEAARSVAKVVVLRHELLGEPLPSGFLARHPEARAALGTTTKSSGDAARLTASTTAKTLDQYPHKDVILDPTHVAEQVRTYWCGPTAMQMIGWGWSGTNKGAAYWASRLGTTTSGTSITAMVTQVNAATGYDGSKYAGPYVTLDVGDWTYKQWLTLLARHVTDYNAPVVLHPILLKRYYPYLDDDASGHFQVGRGYQRPKSKGANLISYFEPWNQARFDPSEPKIARVQWQQAYRSYRANLAHFQHNIGV